MPGTTEHYKAQSSISDERNLWAIHGELVMRWSELRKDWIIVPESAYEIRGILWREAERGREVVAG